jgi:hypothetical protein
LIDPRRWSIDQALLLPYLIWLIIILSYLVNHRHTATTYFFTTTTMPPKSRSKKGKAAEVRVYMAILHLD